MTAEPDPVQQGEDRSCCACGGARVEVVLGGVIACGRCQGSGLEPSAPVAIALDAETLTPQAMIVGCPERVAGPFLGSDASYLACGKLINHEPPHTFNVEWTS